MCLLSTRYSSVHVAYRRRFDLANTRARMISVAKLSSIRFRSAMIHAEWNVPFSPAFYRTRNFASSSRSHAYFIHQVWALLCFLCRIRHDEPSYSIKLLEHRSRSRFPHVSRRSTDVQDSLFDSCHRYLCRNLLFPLHFSLFYFYPTWFFLFPSIPLLWPDDEYSERGIGVYAHEGAKTLRHRTKRVSQCGIDRGIAETSRRTSWKLES